MKVLSLLVVMMMIVSCGQSSGGGSAVNSNIAPFVQLVEVDPVDNIVEIFNGTSDIVDLTNYWLCSRISYERLGTSTVVSGALSILPGQRTVFKTSTLNFNNASADLGLYSTNSFADPNSMVDFVQWGAGGLGRESVAVSKGIWTTGDFVPTPGGINDSITRMSSDTSSAAWQSALKTFAGPNANASDLGFAVGGGQLVVSEVDPINNIVEIYNGTPGVIDISDYWFCSRTSYEQLSSSTLISGSLNIPTQGYVVLQTTGLDLNDTAADLGFYSTNSFANPNSMVDFVQWGAGGLGRESEAVSKGIWSAGTFVSGLNMQTSVSRNSSGGFVSSWSVIARTFGSSADIN